MRRLGRMGMRRDSTFILQVTSMVDMFTIILVFLLKSYSTSAVQVNPADGLSLPQSTSTSDPAEMLKLVVSQDGIYVDDVEIVKMEQGQLANEEIDIKDKQFIKGLFKELDAQAKKSQDIASKNEAVEFEGNILVQADKGLPYSVLKKVMYTSMLAGYANVKLAVLSMQ